MGGCGDGGVGGVWSLALTAQGEGVVAGDVRARINSLSGRQTVCLHLVRVWCAHGFVCVRERRAAICLIMFVCLCACE